VAIKLLGYSIRSRKANDLTYLVAFPSRMSNALLDGSICIGVLPR
jgi:hypothetical protein